MFFVQLRDFPDYAVTDEGQVISFKGGVWRELTQYRTKRGYLSIGLSPFQYLVHRLVMLAFHGPSELQVNHKDMVKTNNRLDNLEYCTPAENTRHAWATAPEMLRERTKAGLASAKAQGRLGCRPSTIPPEDLDKALAMVKAGASLRDAGKEFGISHTRVRHELKKRLGR